MINALLTYSKKSYSLDLRSIAATRVLLALVCIYEFILKFNNLYFYVPGEFFPKPYFQNNPYYLNIFNYFDSPIFFKIVLLVGIVAAIFMALGKYTRLSMLPLWLIIISFRYQIQVERKGFEILILIMFIWLALMPKDDGLIKVFKETKKTTFFNFSSFGWLTQIAFIYFFSFLFKLLDVTWWKDFTAIGYILQKGTSSTPFTQYFLIHKNLPIIATFITLVIESVAPILIFIAFKKDTIRLILIGVMILFHLSIALILHVGLFSPVSICLWISLLPSSFWDKLLKKREKSETIHENIFSLKNILSLALLAYIVTSNIYFYITPKDKTLNFSNNFLLNQRWNLYSNDVFFTGNKDVWPISQSDTNYDVLNERSFTPDYLTNYYPQPSKNHHWRGVYGNITKGFFFMNRPEYAYYLLRFLCRKNTGMKNIKLYVMIRNLDTKTLQHRFMAKQDCRPNESSDITFKN